MTSTRLCYDLHSHTVHSDGTLTQEELILRAVNQGVTHLAITDHDTLRAHQTTDAQQLALAQGLNLITGVEVSCAWEEKELHIVGLNLEPNNCALQSALKEQVVQRRERALMIGDKLVKQNVIGARDYIESFADEQVICRTHLSKFLVERHYAKDANQVFKRYLGKGSKSYVKGKWMSLEMAIQHINAARGCAVLAHPGRYGFSRTKLKYVVDAFRALGGQGIEISYPNQKQGEFEYNTRMCQTFGLHASMGSDFHAPRQWMELGRLHPLPKICKPIWELFQS
ncbi:MAG: PHP domain-containing protein [Pseudomonadota bacterium]